MTTKPRARTRKTIDQVFAGANCTLKRNCYKMAAFFAAEYKAQNDGKVSKNGKETLKFSEKQLRELIPSLRQRETIRELLLPKPEYNPQPLAKHAATETIKKDGKIKLAKSMYEVVDFPKLKAFLLLFAK